MKIFYENKAQGALKGHNTVCLDKEIERTIKHLISVGQVTSNGDLVLKHLRQAQRILDDLIVGMHDENAQLIYPSGSMNDFLEKESRTKKENVDIICDDEIDEEFMCQVMGLASALSQGTPTGNEEISEITISRRA